MAQLVRAQVSYFRMTTIVGNPEVVSSILNPSTFFSPAVLSQRPRLDYMFQYDILSQQAIGDDCRCWIAYNPRSDPQTSIWIL